MSNILHESHDTTITQSFYLSLLEFLLSGKQQLVAVGNEFGLTSIQVMTLLLIDEHNPRSMKRLGMMFHCDASNVTGIVDGLEQKDLVERQNDPTDRRIKTVHITHSGERMQKQIIKQLTLDSESLLAPLSQSEIEQFAHILGKLTAAKRPE